MLLLWFRLVYLFRLTNAKNFNNDISSSVFAFSVCLVPLSAYLLWFAFLHFLNALWGEGDLIVLLPCCLPLFQISESSRSCSLVCKTIKITLHLRFCRFKIDCNKGQCLRSHTKMCTFLKKFIPRYGIVEASTIIFSKHTSWFIQQCAN